MMRLRLPIFVACFVFVLTVVDGAAGRRESAQKPNKPYFVGDFDTCDFSQWQDMQGPAASFKIIRKPRTEGKCAASLTIGSWAAGGLGSLEADGAALRLKTAPYGTVEHTVWQHFSVQFAPNFQAVPGNWNLFIEWHNDPGWKNFPAPHLEYANLCWAVRNIYGVQRLGMRIMGGRSTAPQTLWIDGPRIRTGHWYDFLARTVWSPSRNEGMVEWWLDGKLLYSSHISTLYARPDGSVSSVYYVADHYRRHGDATTTIRFDGFRLGPTRASVRYRHKDARPPH
jgi:polysaccharide lyase-like protein